MRGVLFGLLTLFLVSAGLGSSGSAQAQNYAEDGSFTIDHPLKLLFAQTAKRMTYDGETMVLDGLSPATLFFADRPERLTGHFSNADFVALWQAGEKSFSADPPNAALALLEEANKAPVVVELKSVTLVDKALHYKVRVLEGELPAQSGAVGLFIDPWVWMPPHHRRHDAWLRCHWNRWGVRVCHRHWY